jgi:glutathione S-transferase
MSDLVLVIGNKTYSSWSMRPWVLMTQAGIPFTEELIPLDQPDTRAKILARSAAGRVPVLVDGPLTVWDSLAICETIAERHPDQQLLPADPAARAICRSVCAEMHAGFPALREFMPMNLRRSGRPRPEPLPDAVLADITRIKHLWRDCRERFGQGDTLLFGRFSIADAMFAPVVMRFASYGIVLEGEPRRYAETVEGLGAVGKWRAGALAEPWHIAHDDL